MIVFLSCLPVDIATIISLQNTLVPATCLRECAVSGPRVRSHSPASAESQPRECALVFDTLCVK